MNKKMTVSAFVVTSLFFGLFFAIGAIMRIPIGEKFFEENCKLAMTEKEDQIPMIYKNMFVSSVKMDEKLLENASSLSEENKKFLLGLEKSYNC